MLPEIALLEIFDFHVELSIEAWQTLVHVCRKWRDIVFGSPRRLNLRLYCGARRLVREMLDIWPPLPIVILACGIGRRELRNQMDSIIGHTDRICELDVMLILDSEKVMAVIEKPFPLLTHLRLGFGVEIPPVDLDSFLGGSPEITLPKTSSGSGITKTTFVCHSPCQS
jgi:hypothetical protein